MILAVETSRLILYPEGLTLTGYALALVGVIVFWVLLAHWLVRARAWTLAAAYGFDFAELERRWRAHL